MYGYAHTKVYGYVYLVILFLGFLVLVTNHLTVFRNALTSHTALGDIVKARDIYDGSTHAMFLRLVILVLVDWYTCLLMQRQKYTYVC